MNRKQMRSVYSLKWNPFTPDVPTEALLEIPKIASFCRRVANLVSDGGFALITGEAGNGKSAALRLLEEHLKTLPEVTVGVITRPQSGLSDFYRELGEIFGVELRPHNRWGGFKALRERWRAHAEASLLRPVVLVDEAQEMKPPVLNELRLLSSGHFDSLSFLTVVLCGDSRLLDLFRQPALIPLGTRIRTRLILDYAPREDLSEVLRNALLLAGNPKLMTKELMTTLVEHAAGNYRVLMSMAGELLLAAFEREETQLDEKLYLEVFQTTPNRRERPSTRSRR